MSNIENNNCFMLKTSNIKEVEHRDIGTEDNNRLSKQLLTGKAGEYLTCAEIIMQGYNAFLSDAGQNFDIIVDFNNKLIKVQVKTSTKPWRENIYRFTINEGRLPHARNFSSAEYYAFVALDIKKIAFIPAYFLTKKNGKIIRLMEINANSNYGRNFDMFSRFDLEGLENKTIQDASSRFRSLLGLKYNDVPKGKKHFNAKLSTEEVGLIRELYFSNQLNQVELAKKFKVSQGTIWYIVHLKSRKNA